MKLPNDLDGLKELYISSAIQHGNASIDGDYKLANKEFDRLKKILTKVQESGEECIDFFSDLLKNTNSNVNVWAASHALTLNILIDESIEALKKAASEGPGVANLGAKIILKQWETEGKLGGKSW